MTIDSHVGPPARVSPSLEKSLLARGEPGVTPLARAELHGLELRTYLTQVYGYDVGPPAVHRPRPPAPSPMDEREARARRVLAALAETPDAGDVEIARRVGCGRGVVDHIRRRGAWAHLREAAPLTLRAALE